MGLFLTHVGEVDNEACHHERLRIVTASEIVAGWIVTMRVDLDGSSECSSGSDGTQE